MAVLTGWRAASAIAGTVNPHLTPELSQYSLDYWPAHESVGTQPFAAPTSTHWPVEAAPRAISGWVAGTYVRDFYERIHVTPGRLELGNVVGAQSRLLRVWNAFFTPQVLTALTGLEEGLNLTAPHGLPAVYGGLLEVEWTVEIGREGPGRIDATVNFVFASVPAPALRITGARVVEWAFRPDWSEGITERLAWKTEVLASRSGAEQRRAKRLSPRRSFELPFIVERTDRTRLDIALAAWGGRTWALPIWPDAQVLGAPLAAAAESIVCSTAGRDFRVGGLAMLLGPTPADVESVEVKTISAGAVSLARPTTGTWPAGTLLLPARLADLMQQPAQQRLTDQLARVSAAFELAEVSDWPLQLPVATYRGAPVFATRPEESEDLTNGWARLQEVLDNGGALPLRTDTAGRAFSLQAHRWQLFGRAEHTAWRSLLYALRGRQGAVWLPTHAEDLELVAEVALSSMTMDVRAVGLTRMFGGTPQPGRRDLRIELTDGSALHRRISAVSEISATAERLLLTEAPGVTLRPPGATGVHVWRISFMSLVRLEQDEVELLHKTEADGVAACQVVWRGLRDELEATA